MKSVLQARFVALPDKIQVTLQYAGETDTRKFRTWGEALTFLNFATAYNGAPDPRPPGSPAVAEVKAA